MKQNKVSKFVMVVFLIVLAISTFYFFKNTKLGISAINDDKEVAIPEIQDRQELIKIESNETYGFLMDRAGISPAVYQEIYNTALDEYDLAKIRVGKELELTFEKDTDNLKMLVYKIDSEEEVVVKNDIYFREVAGEELETVEVVETVVEEEIVEDIWEAEMRDIDYEVKRVMRQGEVKTSMYEAALENNIDERSIIELANAFQWTIDFAMDPRVGDTFKFVCEDRYLNGEYAMPGKILAGEYVNAGEKYEVYYFEESEDNIGYFDAEGNSVQKMFLKAPVSFKYISSGFTTGRRYVEAFNVSTGHRAIDYAAKTGTPIRSVGNGTITFAGWNGSYGYMVKVRHNGTYSTNYAHMSKMAVRTGQKVQQGDVIGYVGSTGFSTGPHLHYEMVKNGSKINPLREILPPGKPIKGENQDRFFNEIKQWQEMISE